MKTTFKATLKWALLYPSVIFLCFEIALRILGYQSYHNQDYSIQCTPANAYIGNDSMGIQLNPGTYSILLNEKIRFKATHNKNKHRVIPNNNSPQDPDVLLLGCSFTYGYGVNDNESFASLLQDHYPRYSFENSAVIGYGTVQSLMQLKNAIKNKDLDLVLLNFSSFHFIRNSMAQSYKSNMKIGYKRSSLDVDSRMKTARFPYRTSCNAKIEFADWENMYNNFPGREWLASINWMQTTYDRSIDKKIDQVEITRCIISEMNELCKRHGVSFGLVCLDSSPETEQLQNSLPNVAWHNANFDFESKKHTNLPYDIHPNILGHKYLFEQISPFLKELINGE